MPPPRGARPGKKEFWFQCGKYYARTVEDASDRRADWLSDSWTVHVLNHCRYDVSPAAISCADAADIGTRNIIAAMRHSWGIIFFCVLVRHLPKPAQHVRVVEFGLFEIAGAAEGDGTGMPQNFPQPLRRLYRDRRTCAVNGFTSDKAAIAEIKSQCHEMSDFGHECPAWWPSPDGQPCSR